MDNIAQIEYWNGAAGQEWVRGEDRPDDRLRPAHDAFLAAEKPPVGESAINSGRSAADANGRRQLKPAARILEGFA